MVGAYVLEALEPEAMTTFEAHLEGCASCRAEVVELRQVVDVLPLAVEQVEPPQTLKDRIMAEARVEVDRPSPLTVLPGGTSKPPRKSWLTKRESVLALAAAVVIAALGLWNLHSSNGNSNDQQTALRSEVTAVIAQGGTVSQVASTGLSPGASASMVQSRNSPTAYFLVTGLAASRPARVYELWLFRNLAPRGVATFTYSGSDTWIVKLNASTVGWQAAAVTDEPGPNGSKKPTTKPVLYGKLA
jgi:anti-sigma factor RsiW